MSERILFRLMDAQNDQSLSPETQDLLTDAVAELLEVYQLEQATFAFLLSQKLLPEFMDELDAEMLEVIERRFRDGDDLDPFDETYDMVRDDDVTDQYEGY